MDADFRIVVGRRVGRRRAIVQAPAQIKEAQVSALPDRMQAGNFRASGCG